jgi:SsrA-binding protein
MPTLTTNKKALHNYHVQEKFEAGVVLTGAEVKSVKGGQINLLGSYISARDNALWLINCHISPYKMASTQQSYNPTHDRKLLLKRKEISSLTGTLTAKGLTVLPISVYTKGSLIKLEIGICRGKKQYDKRETIKKRDTDRSMRRLMRNKP